MVQHPHLDYNRMIKKQSSNPQNGESSLFTDLIFITQPNLVMLSKVYLSVHPNCHHQIQS